MTNIKRCFILFFALWTFALSLHAQYEGKEFVAICGFKSPGLAWTVGHGDVDSAYVYLLGHHSGTGYVENSHTSFHITFEIHPDTLVRIAIPAEELYYQVTSNELPLFANISGASIFIKTTVDVQAWFQSPSYSLHDPLVCPNPFKVSLIPTHNLLKSHEILSDYFSQVAHDRCYIVAIEDSTVITVDNHEVFLNRGDFCYIHIPELERFQISTNCKKIAVFYGYFASTSHAYMPDPTMTKGKDFMATALADIPMYFQLGQSPSPLSAYPYPNDVLSCCLFLHHHLYPLCTFDSVIHVCLRYDSQQDVFLRFWDEDAQHYHGGFQIYHPTEKMVSHWDYPITKNTFGQSAPWLDTTYIDISIYTHADGINSTYLNGQHIPATAFDTFPASNGEYYWAQMVWWSSDSLPDYITIDNANGFTAYISEIGYSSDPNLRIAYNMHGSSGYSMSDFTFPHSNLSMTDSATLYRCVGDTLSLDVEHNPDNIPVEWIFNGTSYEEPTLSFFLPQVDTLTVQLVLHYDGCPDTSTTFVVVVPPPVFSYCHDDTLCHGAQLSVEQPNVLSYQWSDGSSGPALTVDSAGTYSVTVTNLGCRAESDLFTIDLYPQSSVSFGNDSILCELATLLLDATQPHPAQYVWQDQSTNTTYTVFEDGQYWVVVTDHCLGASDTIVVGYLTDFTVDLGPDTTLCEGRTLTLSADAPFCDYEWQDGSTQPTYIVRHPGTYSVTASNKCFEHGDDITVEYEPCDQELWMPNSFTPDGDGLNDLFLPVFSYPDEVESYEMTIYDRGGMVIFMTHDINTGWDAAGVPIGTYVVFVRYKSRGHETRDVTGSVTVIR